MSQPPNRDTAMETTGGCSQSTCPEVAAPQPKRRAHGCSRTFAREHGVTAAIVAGYLAYRIAVTGHSKPEGEGYRVTLDDLATHYPYLSRSGIAGALARLVEKGVLVTHQNNVRGFDRTTHYRFASAQLEQQARRDKIYFEVAAAQRFGIAAALVMTNLRMRVTEVRCTNPEATHYRFSARNVVKYLPLSKNTLQRALKALSDAGRVQLVAGRGWDRAAQLDIAHFLAHDSNLEMAAPEADDHSPAVDMNDPNPNSHAPIADNNTTLKEDVERSALEGGCEEMDSYETRPAPPFAGRACLHPHSPEPTVSQSSSGTITGASAQDAASEQTSITSTAAVGCSVPATTDAIHGGVSVNPFRTLVVSDGRAKVRAVAPLEPVDGVKGLRDHLPIKGEPPRGAVPRWNHDTTGTPKFYTQFVDLQMANRCLAGGNSEHWRRIYGAVLTRAYAMFTAWGPAKLHKVVAAETEQQRYEMCRGWIEAFDCPETDLVLGEIELVPKHLMELFVLGCTAYMDPNLEQCEPQIIKMADLISLHLSPYLERNSEVLQRRGGVELRYGELVRQELHRSPDETKEALNWLTAAEKRNVLENALRSRNRIGRWTLHGQRRHNLYICNITALKAAEEFFTNNPEWAVIDLLAIMDFSVEMQLSGGSGNGGYGDHFYSEKANDLGFLMKNFERIRHSEAISQLRLPEVRLRPLKPTAVAVTSSSSSNNNQPNNHDEHARQ